MRYTRETHWDFAPELEFTDIEMPCHDMRAWLAALRLPPLRFLARSPLNAFLVVLLRKPPIR